MTDSSNSKKPDLVDRVLGLLDHALDVVHDNVLRPLIIAGRAIAFGLIALVATVVLVLVLVVGLTRLLNVYAFAGREWISYLLIGLASLLGGLIIWRRRRPVARTKS